MARFHVSAARVGDNKASPEGSFDNLDSARDRLVELGNDPACLIAEVADYDASDKAHGWTKKIVAQYDRQSGSWGEVGGALIDRTHAGAQ